MFFVDCRKRDEVGPEQTGRELAARHLPDRYGYSERYAVWRRGKPERDGLLRVRLCPLHLLRNPLTEGRLTPVVSDRLFKSGSRRSQLLSVHGVELPDFLVMSIYQTSNLMVTMYGNCGKPLLRCRN
jgi:hypothetical protein